MRAVHEAIKNIRRSPYQALAAVMLVFLTFLVGYTLVLFLIGSHRVLQFFETRPEVSAFFLTDTSADSLNQYATELRSLSYVRNVTVIDQNQALQIYQDQIGNDPLLLELVTPDILPPSIEVATTSLDSLSQVAEKLKSYAGVDEVVYQQDVVDSLRYWTTLLRQIGLGVLALFVVTSTLILLTITSIRITGHKSEIRVLRLMGATKWYIQQPFLLEGIIYGVVGSVLAWVAVYIALLYATPTIQHFFADVALVPVPIWSMLLLLAAGTGVGWAIGLIASFLSARRLFRV